MNSLDILLLKEHVYEITRQPLHDETKTLYFIKRSVEIHGDSCDYTEVDYITAIRKVIIICKYRHEFEIMPIDHLRGGGCVQCAGKMRKTSGIFIYEARKVHGTLYEYLKTIYVNAYTPVIITCKDHGDFSQIPNAHLRGHICRECAKNDKKITAAQFMMRAKKIHGERYDYSAVVYMGYQVCVIIRCAIHGLFKQAPKNHLITVGCWKCANIILGNKQRKPREVFIAESREIYGDRCGYEKVVYVDCQTHVIINCKFHGDFSQTPSSHLHAEGCKQCATTGYSKKQLEWIKGIETNTCLEIKHAENGGEHRIARSRCRADGYCENLNTIFEFHGCYWHGCQKCYINREALHPVSKKSYAELYDKTIKKEHHCYSEGYKYIQIWECEWKKIKKTQNTMDIYFRQLKMYLSEDLVLLE